MADFDATITDAFLDGDCLSLVLSKRRAESSHPSERLTARPVEINGELRYQFASRTGKQETHENLLPGRAADRVRALFPGDFEHCHLFTPTADYAARAAAGGTVSVRRSRPTKRGAITRHNRDKAYLIPEGNPVPFLVDIGVMTPDGKVRAAKYHKFRQINRFLELVEDVVPELPDGPLTVVDFGCGKSYLTFALHHLLTRIHQRAVQIVGLDRNASVIEDCCAVARRLDYHDLEFRVGDIAGHEAGTKVNLAVALHACDTATDEALVKAVDWDSDVILAVPCCQHEVAATMRPAGLTALVEHGLLRERLAALATDALRAKALEVRGYRTQVVEFIDMEHTAKNVLIRAVRRARPAAKPAETLAEYVELKRALGLDGVAADRILTASHEPSRAASLPTS